MKTLYRFWLKRASIEDESERTKFRMLWMFFGICIVICVAYWGISPFVQFNVPRFIFAVLATMLVVEASLLLIGVLSTEIAAHLLIASCWLAFVFSAFFSGGIASLVLPWFGLLPVIASLVLDYQRACFWFGVLILTVAGFWFAIPVIPPIRFYEGPWRQIFSTVGLSSILFLFTGLHNRIRYRVQDDLLKANANLTERQNEILHKKKEIRRQLEQIQTINKKLEDSINEADLRNKTMEHHWNVLLDLSKNRTISFGTTEQSFRHILKTTAESLQINRVSIWKCYPERIENIMVYDSIENTFVKGEDLHREVNPYYFDVVQREKIISADDAATHEATTGFAGSYLMRHNIRSMMDAPYFIDGELAGILCCENRHENHRWSCEDIIFATSMADIISMAYRCSMRNENEKRIREMNRRISSQNELILRQNEENKKLNSSLESKVAERTFQLTERNKQLTEYAYINSHSLRGPVARILGLTQLMGKDSPLIDFDEFMRLLRDTATELDGVVGKITNAIERGEPFDRNEIT